MGDSWLELAQWAVILTFFVAMTWVNKRDK